MKFISFGSNSYYQRLAARTLSQIAKLYPGSDYFVFGPSDLPLYIRNYSKKYTRGFGYWRWKPYIISKSLVSCDPGEILIYIDSRCGFKGNSLPWLHDFSEDMIMWELKHIEEDWTAIEIIEKVCLNYESLNDINRSPQLAATFMAIKKSARTTDLISRWHEFIESNLELCRDEPSKSHGNIRFQENRHDQSVLSVLVKVELISKRLKIKKLNFHSAHLFPGIIPHFYPKPISVRMVENLKKFTRIFKTII